MTPEQMEGWLDGDESLFKMLEEEGLMKPERNYRTMTEEEAMKLISQEHPDFVEDAKQISASFKKNPDRYLKKAGAIKNPVVDFLSSLDSFD